MGAVHSMTGSGRAVGTTKLGELTVEVRSVNGRALGVKTKLPPDLHPFERWIEQRVRARLARGSVTVAADLQRDASTEIGQLVERDQFVAVARHLRELAGEAGLALPTVRDVLVVPGVLQQRSAARTSRDPEPALVTVVDEALDALIAERAREGEATGGAVRAEVNLLREHLESVRAHLPSIRDRHRDRLLDRVNDFLRDRAPTLEPEHVIREVALFAERIDVSEETQRLDAHLGKLEETLSGSGPIGRTLDFSLQEALREVNTLGSKTPDAQVAQHVIAMKAAIDRAKEQAANLE